jgi:peptide/nickel transport system substrate-binding protein
MTMTRVLRVLAAAGSAMLAAMAATSAAVAQKPGGVLRVHANDSPPSLTTHEPDLATGWSWSEDGTQLTFPLREGVKWHDGRPFTARDVKCTWDLLTGKSSEKLRLDPRKSWYRNLTEVTTRGDNQVTFHLEPVRQTGRIG